MDFRAVGPRPYAYAGFLGIAVMAIAVFVCMFSDHTWDIRYASMCDFGVSDIAYVSFTFIGGCVVSGILFMISGFGRSLFTDSRYDRAGSLVISLAGLALVCVGVLDETFSFHQYVTISFAAIFMIGILLVSIQDIIDRNYILLIGLALVGLFGFASLFANAIPYAVVQIVLVGYTFIWYIFKSLVFFDISSPLIRRIAGMDRA